MINASANMALGKRRRFDYLTGTHATEFFNEGLIFIPMLLDKGTITMEDTPPPAPSARIFVVCPLPSWRFPVRHINYAAVLYRFNAATRLGAI